MFRPFPFILFFATAAYSDYYYYDVDQIKPLVHKAIDCLDQFPVLNLNATFQTMAAYGNSDFSATVPHLSEGTAKDIEEVQKRLLRIIQNSYDAYPNDPNRELYHSLYWNSLGDFTCKKGGLQKLPPLPDSFQEIVNRNTITEEISNCYDRLIAENPPTPVSRTCKLACEEKMFDKSYNTRIPPSAKINYFGYAMVLNCTNYSPEEYGDIATHFCSYTYLEVMKMVEYVGTPIFEEACSYFLDMVGLCAGYGNNDFINGKIMSAIVKAIGCNGCMGSVHHPPEVSQVLTAETLVVLMNAYRCSVEKNELNRRKYSISFK